MFNDKTLNSAKYLADRKNILVNEGAKYRAEIMMARHAVVAGLSTESLAKSLVDQAINFAYSGLGTILASKIGHGRTVLPLLVGGFSFLSRKAVLKPLVKGVMLAVVVGVIAKFFMRKKIHKI